MPPDDVPATSWMAHVEFADVKAVIGRGGHNTCFYTFGGGKQRFTYPAKLLKLLDQLGRQRHCMYVVRDAEDRAVRRGFVLEKLQGSLPEAKGWVISGVSADGQEDVCYRSKRDVRGRLVWLKS